MKLVIIPDADGDSFTIIDEKFPPENFVEPTFEYLTKTYDRDDLAVLIHSFNYSKG